jgi:hypothetical protein
MLESHEAHDGRNDLGLNKEHRDVAGDRPIGDRPLADREVPVPGSLAAQDGALLAINQWLDGDVTEADARRADNKQVDMWKLVATETERRKRMVTPAYVAANIMAALPDKAAATQTAAALAASTTPSKAVAADNERGLSMNAAVAIGAGLFALGLLVGKLLF